MGGVHGHQLYVHGHGAIHRLAPELKVVATLVFVVAVVLTPRTAFWAFAAYAVLVAAVIVAAGLPARYVLRRLVFELPFVLFAVFLPFIGQGERVEVLGLSLSVSGLWGAWNIVVKGTLGVAASIVLAATTTVPELLRGLDHLRMPKVITAIMGFMIRYGDVIAGDMRRMRIARQSRGYDPKWIWQAKGVAASAGALFIRSFERGERVHVAMLARGYDGTMPPIAPERRPAPADWARALTLPAIAAAIAAVALVAQ
jgi:cobalt/nickel transport system permease protein